MSSRWNGSNDRWSCQDSANPENRYTLTGIATVSTVPSTPRALCPSTKKAAACRPAPTATSAPKSTMWP